MSRYVVMPKFHRVLPFVAVACLATLGGCKALTVPQGLAEQSTKMPVAKVDRGHMKFGEYEVHNIRRGWSKGGGISVGGLGASKKSRDFSFLLARGAESFTVTCKLQASSTSAGSITVDSSEQVLCDMASGETPWKIVLVGQGNKSVSGRLQKGEREIQISPAHGGAFGPRGYYIREGQEVAAVDVSKKFRTVWLRTELEAEVSLALATAATALMIYEEVA